MVAGALVLLLLLNASGVAAEECEVLDIHGYPRSCTFTEEAASCLLDSEDSFEQCREDTEGFWARTVGCGVTHAADDLACVLAAPVTWGIGKIF
jgi:hypothetical protein